MTKPAKTALISGIICTAFTAFITTCFGFSSDTPPPPAKSKEVELAELRKADSIYSAAKYAAAYRLDSMVDNALELHPYNATQDAYIRRTRLENIAGEEYRLALSRATMEYTMATGEDPTGEINN